ncbi:MAG: hypothetical protein ACMG6E_08525 [Candidatus Roizmanbacteria bacterium]
MESKLETLLNRFETLVNRFEGSQAGASGNSQSSGAKTGGISQSKLIKTFDQEVISKVKAFEDAAAALGSDVIN